jgi:tetratricopeptide (TPR) repeat protein
LAEHCARAALERAHKLNKNPRDGEASMLLAAALERQGDNDGAWESYYKASWSGNCRDAAFWSLARLAMKRADYAGALEKVDQSLRFNGSNNLAMGLKALVLAKLDRSEQALEYIRQQLADYPLSYTLHYARWAIGQDEDSAAALLSVTGRRGTNACELAGWLTSLGQQDAARDVLELLDSQETLPMLWRASLSDNPQSFIIRARECLQNRVRFPNTLDEVQMLQTLAHSAFARYLLGCFWYSKRRYDEAVSCWQFTLEQEPDFAPVHRLLGIYAWNKQHDAQLAERYLSQAVALEPKNARFLFELDYLNKLLAQPAKQRLARLEASKEVVFHRDDLTVELLSLWNGVGHYDAAAAVLNERVFHPWEGGEGKATGQYLLNQLHRALAAIHINDFPAAIVLLQQALHYPQNLGEGRLPGQTDNDIWYLLGHCAQQQGHHDEAQRYFVRATRGGSSLDAGRYYNDQPVDYLFWQGMALKAMGDTAQADTLFHSFLQWVDTQHDQVPDVDFFAVSLPDLVVLDTSAHEKHQQHCLFINALGHLGLGNLPACQHDLDALLQRHPAHDKALLLRHAINISLFQ